MRPRLDHRGRLARGRRRPAARPRAPGRTSWPWTSAPAGTTGRACRSRPARRCACTRTARPASPASSSPATPSRSRSATWASSSAARPDPRAGYLATHGRHARPRPRRRLRVIAGEWRGRPLKAPPGAATRPTSDRVREALFSILGARIRGARVLDLFAGSGALGIEALSRRAAHALFVVDAAAAVKAIRANLEALGAQAEVR